jgi:hypothetical protein
MCALIPKPLPYRHPGHPQALIDALASRKICWMVASVVGAKQADREDRMKREARLCCSSCLVKLTKVGQYSGEKKVCERAAAVNLDGPPIPGDRFGIEAAPQLGGAYIQHPQVRHGVARREAECLADMGFGLLTSTNERLSLSYSRIGDGQIPVQH